MYQFFFYINKNKPCQAVTKVYTVESKSNEKRKMSLGHSNFIRSGVNCITDSQKSRFILLYSRAFYEKYY